MMAWLRRLFSTQPSPPQDSFYQRLHDAKINALAQTEASQRATRRIREQATRDFADTLAVPPIWHREGGRHDSR